MNGVQPRRAVAPFGVQPATLLGAATGFTGTRLIAALAILLSMSLAAAMGEVINRDGIIYVRSAQAFLDSGGFAG